MLTLLTLWSMGVGAQNVEGFGSISSGQASRSQSRDNSPPVAQSVIINNPLHAKLGQTLRGTYEYYDADSDLESGTSYQWYRSGSENADGTYNPISGAIAKEYTVTGDDLGRFLKFAVTPRAATGSVTGTEVFSSYSNQVTDLPRISLVDNYGGFTESDANDGSIVPDSYIEVSLAHATFISGPIQAKIINIPSGLSILSVTRVSDITIQIKLSGRAIVHEAAASILNPLNSQLKVLVSEDQLVGVYGDLQTTRGITISFKNNPVQNFARQSVGHNRITLSWDTPAGLSPLNSALSAYQLYRNGSFHDAVLVDNTRIQYTDYSVSTGNNYYYDIYAVYGNSLDKPIAGTIYATSMALSSFNIIKPSNHLESVNATINHTLQTIFVEMPNGTDLGSLVANFSPNPSNASVKVNSTSQTSGETAQNFTNSHLSPIPYVLTSATNSSTCTYWVTVMAATSLNYPIPRDGLGTTSSIQTKWWQVSNATNYYLDVSTQQNFTNYVSGLQNLAVGTAGTVITALEPDTEYFFRVRAYSSDLDEYSNYSPVRSVRTLPVGEGTGSVELTNRNATPVNIGSFSGLGFTVTPSLSITASTFTSTSDNVIEVSMGLAPSPGGLFYRLSFNNPSIGNGTYVFSYAGLPYDPTDAGFSVNGGSAVSLGSSAVIDTENKTISFTISGLNLSAKSSYTIDLLTNDGSDITLPLTLSTFTATATNNGEVLIRWDTESESTLSGFKIVRGTCSDVNLAETVSVLIPANNVSGQSTYSFRDQSISDSGLYYYWLQVIELSGKEEYFGHIVVYVDLEAPSEPPFIAQSTGIKSIYPNPFNPSTTITYDIVEAGTVSLDIFNMRGQKVKTLVSGFKPADRYLIIWDSKDDHGKQLPSGAYFIRLQTPEHHGLSKLTLLK